MLRTRPAIIGFAVPFVLAFPACSSGSSEPDGADASAETSSAFVLDSDAADGCEGLVAAQVQDMASALPLIGNGAGTTDDLDERALAGASALSEASEALTGDLADAAADAAVAIEAYVARPGNHAHLRGVLRALDVLAAESESECGL